MHRLGRHWHWLASAVCVLVVGTYLLSEPPARGGGPIILTGPANATPGSAFTWDLASLPNHRIQYTLDSGPLSADPSGMTVIDHDAGTLRVQAMFQTWQNVPTASIAFNNAGPIKPTGSFAGGDVKTVQDFAAVDGSCNMGVQSPIIFDADGSIVQQLTGDPGVIGFTSLCKQDPISGHFVTAEVVLNGRFQDGINDPQSRPPNFELTTNEFNQAFTHEFGHFSGLDHSQINVDLLGRVPGGCPADGLAGLPVMFPILFCQDRVTAGLPPLAPDDIAWISRLYPVTAPPPAGKTVTTTAYGTISGRILFTDGVTLAQGVNVIARQVDDPSTPQNESLRNAVSVVSGYRFTGNPGQSVTCAVPDPANPECNNGGSPLGSRDPVLIGVYDIPVPIPQGASSVQFTISVESINPGFAGGSSVGPLDPPIPIPGSAMTSKPVAVQAGQSVRLDVTLEGTPPRLDPFESVNVRMSDPSPAWDRKRTPLLGQVRG